MPLNWGVSKSLTTSVHPLKEVDAAAMAWAETPEQVVEILTYVVNA